MAGGVYFKLGSLEECKACILQLVLEAPRKIFSKDFFLLIGCKQTIGCYYLSLLQVRCFIEGIDFEKTELVIQSNLIG